MGFLGKARPIQPFPPSNVSITAKKHQTEVLIFLSLWVPESAKGKDGEQPAIGPDLRASSQVKEAVPELCSSQCVILHQLKIYSNDKHLSET